MMKQNFPSIILFGVLIFFYSSLSAQHANRKTLFNDGWKFYKGDVQGADAFSFNDAGWRNVDIPHDWTIEGPFDEKWASATGYLPGGIGWYRKTFTLNPVNKNVFIYFDGVYRNSEVWINGHYLGKRPNGFVPFQYDLTPFLNKSGKNVIAVKVDHSQFADSRWYTGSGIYRNVYLVQTDPLHIDLWGIGFTTPSISRQEASAQVSFVVVNETLNAAIVNVLAELVDAKGKKVAEGSRQFKVSLHYKNYASVSLKLKDPLLWSVDDPSLYKLVVTVIHNGKQTDKVEQQVGFRTIHFDKDKGFFLNGKNLKLKGVCIHDDAGALGVAVPEEVWARRLAVLKEAGCNSIRMSHNPHADYLYDLADRMGFLIMDEAFDEWEAGKNKWIKGWNVGKPGNDGYHSDFAEWSERDIAATVLRSRNHPSVILWSIGNEVDYPNDPYTHEVLNTGRNPQIYGKGFLPDHPPASRLRELAKPLVAVVKKYDTSRPVTAALAGVVMSNEVGVPELLDVVGYNYQEFRYEEDHKKYPDRIIYGSENGMGYSAWKAVTDHDFIAGQYLWTGVDYLGEANTWPARSNTSGLIDLAGFKKPQFYFRQSLWSQKPMVYIGTSLLIRRGNKGSITASWNYKDGDSVRITCYTNCEEAELFINGVSSGTKKLADASEKVITWDVVYHPGEVTVKGINAGKLSVQYFLKTPDAASAIDAVTYTSSFIPNNSHIKQVEIFVTDKNANPVYNAVNEITVRVKGPAKLLGLESGDPTSHEDYRSVRRKVMNGRLIAYIQLTGQTGKVSVELSSPGLQPKVIELR